MLKKTNRWYTCGALTSDGQGKGERCFFLRGSRAQRAQKHTAVNQHNSLFTGLPWPSLLLCVTFFKTLHTLCTELFKNAKNAKKKSKRSSSAHSSVQRWCPVLVEMNMEQYTVMLSCVYRTVWSCDVYASAVQYV